MDPITYEEDLIHFRTNNGGLTHLADNYKNKTIQTYGYDFTSNYPSLMASEELLIPTTKPVEIILEELPKRKHIKLGIYRVKITSDDKDFLKVFSFSKFHYYKYT